MQTQNRVLNLKKKNCTNFMSHSEVTPGRDTEFHATLIKVLEQIYDFVKKK